MVARPIPSAILPFQSHFPIRLRPDLSVFSDAYGGSALIRKTNRKRGISVRFITVYFGVVAEIADRAAVMRRGDAVEHAGASDVLAKSQQADTQSLLDVVPGRDWISGLSAAV
ncbi:hypothetical protein [Roseicyclus sp.]|uniref:hypothetical protein n=1 Tax=Roseicyclus sp. TaxID=1914329 RepID=UPI001BCDCA9A|nr:hypothetical protein [Roseicyclus sp.]